MKLVAFGRLGLVSQALFTGVVDAALLSPPDTIEARRIGTAHVYGSGHGADPLPVHFGRHHQSRAGKIAGGAGSVSPRNTSWDQTCADQSGYGKEEH